MDEIEKSIPALTGSTLSDTTKTANELASTAGRMAATAVPLLGPIAVEAFNGIERRRQRRFNEFFVELATELDAELDQLVTLVESDSWTAYLFDTGSRIAAEDASATKIQLLAQVVQNGWRMQSGEDRDWIRIILDTIDRLQPAHVTILMQIGAPGDLITLASAVGYPLSQSLHGLLAEMETMGLTELAYGPVGGTAKGVVVANLEPGCWLF